MSAAMKLALVLALAVAAPAVRAQIFARRDALSENLDDLVSGQLQPVVGIKEHVLAERAPSPGTYSAVIAIGASYRSVRCPYASSLQPAPYVGGRKSNGPIVFEHLASSLGASLIDLAYTGAFVDQAIPGSSTTVPSTRDQTASYIADSNSGSVSYGPGRRLIAFQVGINPLIAIWNTALGAGNTAAAKSAAQASIDANVAAVLNQIKSIRSETGNCGTDFLVMAIPPLETVPNIWYAANYDSAKLDTMSMLEQRYNQALLSGAQGLSRSWSKVTPFAVRDLWYDATYNPQNYNLNVGTVPCFDGTNVCSAPASYLYWDSLHPTTAFHQLLAQRILAIL